MKVDINELCQGKGTIIRGRDYPPTRDYVEPFLEAASKVTDNITAEAVMPEQITKDITKDITYNRVWIQAVLPQDAYAGHPNVVGFIYGLDVKDPVAKFYRGAINSACTNLCVFRPEELHVQQIEPGKKLDYARAVEMFNAAIDMTKEFDRLHELSFGRDLESVERELGRWVRNAMVKSWDQGRGKVKLATTVPVAAFRKLFLDAASPYYVPKEQERVDMFTVYNAFTQMITDDAKDIMNKVEKTLLIKDVLECW